MIKAIAAWTPGAENVQSQFGEWWVDQQPIQEVIMPPETSERDSTEDGVMITPGSEVELRVHSLNGDLSSTTLVISGTAPNPQPPAPPTGGTMSFELTA